MNLYIRKAQSHEVRELAQLLFFAMENILYLFIGERSKNKAINFLEHMIRLEHSQYSYNNCYVALASGRIAGGLLAYAGELLGTLSSPVISFIREHYNPAFDPEPETGPGELYIDCIAVYPELRGKGIGTALLQFVIAENRQEYLVPGLMVEQDNTVARNLYKSLGFRLVGKKQLLGKTLDHMQYL
jgi:ribosomal protein S18 acetylase RimI-like enzyme